MTKQQKLEELDQYVDDCRELGTPAAACLESIPDLAADLACTCWQCIADQLGNASDLQVATYWNQLTLALNEPC